MPRQGRCVTQRAGALASPGARALIAEIRKVVVERELPGKDIWL